MSKSDKINKIFSYGIILLLIKQEIDEIAGDVDSERYYSNS